MIALPIALLLFGYWVMYAGVKRSSLADAWSCLPQQQATPTPGGPTGPGTINVTPITGGPTLGVSTDCRPRPGDTRLPGGFIWRPIGSGILGQVNGQLIGPC